MTGENWNPSKKNNPIRLYPPTTTTLVHYKVRKGHVDLNDASRLVVFESLGEGDKQKKRNRQKLQSTVCSRTEDRTQNHLGTCSSECERDIITIRPCDLSDFRHVLCPKFLMWVYCRDSCESVPRSVNPALSEPMIYLTPKLPTQGRWIAIYIRKDEL